MASNLISKFSKTTFSRVLIDIFSGMNLLPTVHVANPFKCIDNILRIYLDKLTSVESRKMNTPGAVVPWLKIRFVETILAIGDLLVCYYIRFSVLWGSHTVFCVLFVLTEMLGDYFIYSDRVLFACGFLSLCCSEMLGFVFYYSRLCVFASLRRFPRLRRTDTLFLFYWLISEVESNSTTRSSSTRAVNRLSSSEYRIRSTRERCAPFLSETYYFQKNKKKWSSQIPIHRNAPTHHINLSISSFILQNHRRTTDLSRQ